MLFSLIFTSLTWDHKVYINDKNIAKIMFIMVFIGIAVAERNVYYYYPKSMIVMGKIIQNTGLFIMSIGTNYMLSFIKDNDIV